MVGYYRPRFQTHAVRRMGSGFEWRPTFCSGSNILFLTHEVNYQSYGYIIPNHLIFDAHSPSVEIYMNLT